MSDMCEWDKGQERCKNMMEGDRIMIQRWVWELAVGIVRWVGGVKVERKGCEGELGFVKSQENGQLGLECDYVQDWTPIRGGMFEEVMLASESLIV